MKSSSSHSLGKNIWLFLFDTILIALILIGLCFRFYWANWSQGADLHPDEYGLTGTLTQLSMPKTLSDYFNTRLSPISPYQKYDINGQPTQQGPDNRMRWGQWPIILLRWAAELTGNTGYGEQRLLGRSLSALADALTLFVLFLCGERLYSTRTGLLAAALGSLAVMQIQQSHFMTADNFAVLFGTIAVYAAIQACLTGIEALDHRNRTPVWVWYGWFGIAFGMTVASRINLALMASVIVLAPLAVFIEQRRRAFDAGLPVAGLGSVVKAFLCLVLAGALSLVTFRLTQPMAFRAVTGDTSLLTVHFNQDWWDSMLVAQNESSGVNAGPPGEQWTNRIPIEFPLMNIVMWGMGLPLGLMAWIGMVLAIFQILKGGPDWYRHLIPAGWAAAFFVFTGTRHVMSMRYFLPIYPFLILMAAWALMCLLTRPTAFHDRARIQTGKFSPWGTALIVLVLGGTLVWANAFVSAVYRQDNTRVQASRWMYQNIPGTLLLKLNTENGSAGVPIISPATISAGSDIPFILAFTPQVSGTLSQIEVSHARTISGQPGLMQISILSDMNASTSGDGGVLTSSMVPVDPLGTDTRGEASSANLAAVNLTAGQTYYLMITANSSDPVLINRTVLANENWDESLPVRIDGIDPFGQLYTGQTMQVRWADDSNKRDMFLTTLQSTDYIILPSQRAIWSVARLLDQYPLTKTYYEALFDGRLGFEKVAEINHPFTIGPLEISDAGGTAAWGKAPELPLWNNNLLAAEEAFTVYDHAPVWIFKKTANFNINTVRAILEAVPLKDN
jgi:4-amino-4-deoxy-L-arabinose transferase-like glycosyltransferase